MKLFSEKPSGNNLLTVCVTQLVYYTVPGQLDCTGAQGSVLKPATGVGEPTGTKEE